MNYGLDSHIIFPKKRPIAKSAENYLTLFGKTAIHEIISFSHHRNASAIFTKCDYFLTTKFLAPNQNKFIISLFDNDLKKLASSVIN